MTTPVNRGNRLNRLTTARSTHRGLTTRGRCLLAGGIAACVCGVILDERDLLRVGLLAALLPLTAWAVTATRRPRLTATHHLSPSRLSPGMSGDVQLVITNDGGSRTRPIELLEAGTPELSQGAHCLIPALGRGRSAAATYSMLAQRRGRFLIGPPLVRLGDPFGTWEDNRTLPVVTEVLVVPTVVPLHGSPTSGGWRSAASGRAVLGNIGGDPDVGVRPYQRGDDIRTVHWRASARYDDLMVRLTEPVSHGGATVVIDHRSAGHGGEGVDASLELAASLVASVALHLLAEDHHLRLLSHRGDQLAGGHDIADQVLAELALLNPDDDARIDPTTVVAGGLLIVVLGRMDSATTATLVAARKRGSVAVAFVLSVADWDGGSSSAAAAAALSSAGWRVVVVHRGDDLATAWRQACAPRVGFQVPSAARQAPEPVAGR